MKRARSLFMLFFGFELTFLCQFQRLIQLYVCIKQIMFRCRKLTGKERKERRYVSCPTMYSFTPRPWISFQWLTDQSRFIIGIWPLILKIKLLYYTERDSSERQYLPKLFFNYKKNSKDSNVTTCPNRNNNNVTCIIIISCERSEPIPESAVVMTTSISRSTLDIIYNNQTQFKFYKHKIKYSAWSVPWGNLKIQLFSLSPFTLIEDSL